MRNPRTTLCFLVVLLPLLAGCVVQSQAASASNNTVQMGPNNFLQTTLTITVGQPILFSVDQTTGTTHILVIGKQGVPEAEAGAPNFGASGVTITPGQSWTSPLWTTPGTYHVTCTIHPQMTLTVTVTAQASILTASSDAA